MSYQAQIYAGAILKNTIFAGSLEVLKDKCRVSIENENITSIEVLKSETLGYFKLPKEFEEIIEKEYLL